VYRAVSIIFVLAGLLGLCAHADTGQGRSQHDVEIVTTVEASTEGAASCCGESCCCCCGPQATSPAKASEGNGACTMFGCPNAGSQRSETPLPQEARVIQTLATTFAAGSTVSDMVPPDESPNWCLARMTKAADRPAGVRLIAITKARLT
jgi:hypothetical protein